MDLGQVIAVRSLQGPDGEPIVVTIGMPREFDDQSGWFCPYRITCAGTERLRYAGGIDSMQALQLVMLHVGANLVALSRRLGGIITWNGSADLGFPSPDDGS